MNVSHPGSRLYTPVAVLAFVLWTAPTLAIEPAKPMTEASLKSWAATVWVDGKHECGASLIDPHWVLTARHCVSSYCGKTRADLEVVQVRVPDHPTFPAKGVICPKIQGSGLWPSDVALVLIQYVRDVDDKLPAFGQTSMPQSFSVVSVGWSNGSGTRDSAHSLDLVPPSRKQCMQWLSDEKTCPEQLPLGSSQFCAWAAKIPKSFHGLQKGDSGGPAVRTGGQPEVVGVASAACSTGLAIFEDVSQYRQWIANEVCNYYKPWHAPWKSCLKRLGR